MMIAQVETGYDEHLNMEGVACPLPLLKMKQRLKQMTSGKILYVTTTDSGSVKDFTTYINQTDHVLIKQEYDQQRFHFWIKKPDGWQ